MPQLSISRMNPTMQLVPRETGGVEIKFPWTEIDQYLTDHDLLSSVRIINTSVYNMTLEFDNEDDMMLFTLAHPYEY